MPYLSYEICVWGHAAKLYISKLLVLQKRALQLIYFAPSDPRAIPLFSESKILPVIMIYFDTVANLMHDIWKGLVPSPIRALFTKSNEIHRYNTRHAAKGNYIRKEVKLRIFKGSFSRTGSIDVMESNFSKLEREYLNQSLRKKWPEFLFESLSDRDDYGEFDTLTQFLKLYCLIYFN